MGATLPVHSPRAAAPDAPRWTWGHWPGRSPDSRNKTVSPDSRKKNVSPKNRFAHSSRRKNVSFVTPGRDDDEATGAAIDA